jgi:hypothetical protein
VVVGAQAKLAIECDGDTWHGPDRYEADLARQRDLERCGWNFFRIPESRFNIDPASALRGLWETLEEFDIHPSGWVHSAPLSAPTDLPPRPDSQVGEPQQQLPSAIDQSPIPSTATGNPPTLQSTGISQPSSQSGPLHTGDPELDPQENLEGLGMTLTAFGVRISVYPDAAKHARAEAGQRPRRSPATGP